MQTKLIPLASGLALAATLSLVAVVGPDEEAASSDTAAPEDVTTTTTSPDEGNSIVAQSATPAITLPLVGEVAVPAPAEEPDEAALLEEYLAAVEEADLQEYLAAVEEAKLQEYLAGRTGARTGPGSCAELRRRKRRGHHRPLLRVPDPEGAQRGPLRIGPQPRRHEPGRWQPRPVPDQQRPLGHLGLGDWHRLVEPLQRRAEHQVRPLALEPAGLGSLGLRLSDRSRRPGVVRRCRATPEGRNSPSE